ncbi:hypothetical protein [Devosia sp. RR2S18]|uniref:hypothetical protein n=1 Tax=Devosia rhizosphaerae TaxID=3049774 RepID=UPI0025410FD7|nr:hypothetical protein [Devosia sp. RR2S18]WIJ26434.1 hypothetical protein QOV41_06645 [Devosia sp. RR2S18]
MIGTGIGFSRLQMVMTDAMDVAPGEVGGFWKAAIESQLLIATHRVFSCLKRPSLSAFSEVRLTDLANRRL